MASKMVWIEYYMVSNQQTTYGPFFIKKKAETANEKLFYGYGKTQTIKALAKKATAATEENV